MCVCIYIWFGKQSARSNVLPRTINPRILIEHANCPPLPKVPIGAWDSVPHVLTANSTAFLNHCSSSSAL